MIEVLDKGYVRLVDSMGTDLSTVNAARVSYDKESLTVEERDAKLLRFLAKHKHTAPFRHAAVSFEVYAPLMVARQWWKHAVASSHVEDQLGWNESSRRYVTEEPTFYLPAPDEWRSKPENSKQGSGEVFSTEIGYKWTKLLTDWYEEGEAIYNWAMAAGIAPEQARLFLPANGMYVRWRWTASLHSALHFLSLRLEHGAQHEIVEYARAVEQLIQPIFPNTVAAYLEA